MELTSLKKGSTVMDLESLKRFHSDGTKKFKKVSQWWNWNGSTMMKVKSVNRFHSGGTKKFKMVPQWWN